MKVPKFLSLLLLSVSPVLAAGFIEPNDSLKLFDSNKLGVEETELKKLTRSLSQLLQREQTNSALDYRINAKIIALLDRLPSDMAMNQEFELKLLAGKEIGKLPHSELRDSKLIIYQNILILSSRVGVEDAQLIGGAMRDIMADVDLLPTEEVFDWQGVIASLDQFEAATPKLIEDVKAAELVERNLAPMKLGKLDATIRAPYRVLRERINPVDRRWVKVEGDGFVEVRMLSGDGYIEKVLSIEEYSAESFFEKGGFDFIVAPDENVNLTEVFGEKLVNWFAEHHGLELGGELAVILNQQYNLQNQNALLAPLCLASLAARDGLTLHPDLALSFAMNSRGDFVEPYELIRNLRTLERQSRGGLLLQTEVDESMLEGLMVRSPNFFVKWEVCQVDDMADAVERAMEIPRTEQLAKAREQFAEVRKVMTAENLASMIKNTHVRQRLSQVLAHDPQHISAKMLLAAGENGIPEFYTEMYVAEYLWKVIEELDGENLADQSLLLDPDFLAKVGRCNRYTVEIYKNVQKDHSCYTLCRSMLKSIQEVKGNMDKLARHRAILEDRGEYATRSEIDIVDTYERRIESSISDLPNKYDEVKNQLAFIRRRTGSADDEPMK